MNWVYLPSPWGGVCLTKYNCRLTLGVGGGGARKYRNFFGGRNWGGVGWGGVVVCGGGGVKWLLWGVGGGGGGVWGGAIVVLKAFVGGGFLRGVGSSVGYDK